jgi:hypothetical protein
MKAMNIDERLEALAQSLELVVSLHRDNERRLAQVMDTMNRLGRIIEIHEQRLDEHDGRLDDLGRKQ